MLPCGNPSDPHAMRFPRAAANGGAFFCVGKRSVAPKKTSQDSRGSICAFACPPLPRRREIPAARNANASKGAIIAAQPRSALPRPFGCAKAVACRPETGGRWGFPLLSHPVRFSPVPHILRNPALIFCGRVFRIRSPRVPDSFGSIAANRGPRLGPASAPIVPPFPRSQPPKVLWTLSFPDKTLSCGPSNTTGALQFLRVWRKTRDAPLSHPNIPPFAVRCAVGRPQFDFSAGLFIVSLAFGFFAPLAGNVFFDTKKAGDAYPPPARPSRSFCFTAQTVPGWPTNPAPDCAQNRFARRRAACSTRLPASPGYSA